MKTEISKPRSCDAAESVEWPISNPKRIASRDLLRGQPEIVIEHGGSEYHLRITRQGKLILTK